MRIQENQTYQTKPALQGALNASYDLGASLPPPRKPKQVTPNQFPGLMDIAKQGPGAPQQAPQQAAQPAQQISNIGIGQLGSETVPFGGSTKFEKFHPGVDIANKMGTEIPTFAEGTVSQVGVSPSFGNYVMVKDTHGSTHRYSHLHQSYVKKGQKVGRGAVLGTMGNTGNTYSLTGGDGTHLDYRIYDLYGKYINPYSYLKEKYS